MSEWRQRANRVLLIWVAISFALLIALGGVTIALIAASIGNQAGGQAKNAAAAAKSIASCVNDVLGTRAGPAARDNAAHIAFAGVVSSAVAKSPLTPYLARQAVIGLHLDLPTDRPLTDPEVVRGISAYTQALIEDQKQRDKHPLGKC